MPGKSSIYPGLANKMMDSHGDYYLSRVRENENRLIGNGMLQCRREMDNDFANIRQAWLWAVERQNYQALSAAAAGLYVYFDMHTRYHEAEALFRPAKELFVKTWKSGMSPDGGVILLCWFDMQAQGLAPSSRQHPGTGALQNMMTMTRKLLREAVRNGNNRSRGIALLLMGAIAHNQNCYLKAIRFFRLGLGRDPGLEHSFWVHMRIGLCWRALGRMKRRPQVFQKKPWDRVSAGG